MAPEIDLHILLQPTYGWRYFWLPSLTILVGALVATWVGNAVVDKLIEPYVAQVRKSLKAENEVGSLRRGFSDGGKLIGMLERF